MANPQNLGNLETTNPGTVQDSNNQVHARGEHASTTISIDGFALPGANQGRIGQVLTPSVVQSADVLTGAYAPEYGGETAAILNLNLRSGSIRPTTDVTFGGGFFPDFASGEHLRARAGRRERKLRYQHFRASRTHSSTQPATAPTRPDAWATFSM